MKKETFYTIGKGTAAGMSLGGLWAGGYVGEAALMSGATAYIPVAASILLGGLLATLFLDDYVEKRLGTY